MTFPTPPTLRAISDPDEALLCGQTLMGVPIADAPRAARARLMEKRERAARLAERTGRTPDGLRRVTGTDGVTRWFDDQANVVARSSSRDCDACQVIRLNQDLDQPPRGSLVPLLVGALLVIAACVLALAFT